MCVEASQASLCLISYTLSGSVGWYAWSIFIPEDGYPDDPNPDHWQILCQFHDQPNADLGG